MFSFLWVENKNWNLGCVIDDYLILWYIAKEFSKVVVPFPFSGGIYESFVCSTSSLTISIISLFYFSHPSKWERAFHCDFNSHFSDALWCWQFFTCFWVIDWYVICCGVPKSYPFWFGWLSFDIWFMRVLYILSVSPLSDIYAANIFSRLVFLFIS